MYWHLPANAWPRPASVPTEGVVGCGVVERRGPGGGVLEIAPERARPRRPAPGPGRRGCSRADRSFLLVDQLLQNLRVLDIRLDPRVLVVVAVPAVGNLG